MIISNEQAMIYLFDKLNKEEMYILQKMIYFLKEGNRIQDIRDKDSYRELAEVFDVSRNRIKKYLDTLYSIGVYRSYGRWNYWYLNPWIAAIYKTKFKDQEFLNIFKDTEISKYCK
jgi:hypothetical protein